MIEHVGGGVMHGKGGGPEAGACEGSLYGEVTNDIMGNGHMGTPGQTETDPTH